MNNPDPNALLLEIESLKESLTSLGNDFSEARHTAAVTEQAYEKEVAKIYISLLDPKEREKMGLEKLPAEDMRKAIAHSKMDENTWSAYLMSQADVESLTKLMKVKESVLTGCQAQLNQLRVEMSHA
jgi:hypothetical protein